MRAATRREEKRQESDSELYSPKTCDRNSRVFQNKCKYLAYLSFCTIQGDGRLVFN